MGKRLELALGILNGTVGDRLARAGNGLAIPMELFAGGRPLAMDRGALLRAHPSASPRVVLLVHGLMSNESVWAFPDGSDYGSLLARDLGFTALYLRYNTGLAIADNGAALARMLEEFVDAYPAPLEEIVLLGYSMGGLVVRGACHIAALAGHRWLARVRRAVYVATPHRGAPLERVGRSVTMILDAIGLPYTRLVAEIANLRSAGLQDLGDADVRHEDRARRIRSPLLRDERHPVPLLPAIEHFHVAGTIWADRFRSALLGDALVPVGSATDAKGAPRGHNIVIVPGVGHVELAHHSGVYEHIRGWLAIAP